MMRVAALARMAKEDFVEAFDLYFEPLFALWKWSKRLFSSADSDAGNFNSKNFFVTPAAGLVRPLAGSLGLIGPQEVKESGSLLLLESSLGGRAKYFDRTVFADLDPVLQVSREESFVRDLLERRLSAAAELFLAASPASEVSYAESIYSLARISQYHYPKAVLLMVGHAQAGKSSFLNSLFQDARPAKYPPLLNVALEAQVPMARAPFLSRFEVYTEIANFLDQEGYEEAAAAVMARAIELFRFGKVISSKLEE